MGSSGWDADVAVARCPIVSWQGSAWRLHRQKYAGSDPGGSLKVSGRYHRGSDRFVTQETWSALYLALSPETCLGELIRHITPELLPHLNGYRISELRVSLMAVADCRDATLLGMMTDSLVHDRDYRATQQLGAAVVAVGLEGMLVPSATVLGDNLIVFTAQMHADSEIEVINSRDPRLFVDRD